MQLRHAREESFRCIARLNSLSASILLWPFLHLNLFAFFFSTSLQNTLPNWNGVCKTNTKDDSTHHVWNFSLSVCLRVGSCCQWIWFRSWGPNWFYRTTNHVCRRTCLVSRLSAPSLCVTSPCGALIGPPTAYRECPCRDQLGWWLIQGDEPPKRQPFVSCEWSWSWSWSWLSCGLVMWTSFIHAFFKHTSSAREVWLLSSRVVSWWTCVRVFRSLHLFAF